MNTIALESLYILDQPAEIIAKWDDLLEQPVVFFHKLRIRLRATDFIIIVITIYFSKTSIDDL